MADGFKPLHRQGYTSTVYYLPGEPRRVCKAFNEDCITTLYPVEKAAYERFAAHNPPSSILKYCGVHDSIPSGLVLEFAENTDVYNYLWDQQHLGGGSPDSKHLLRWAGQAAEALEFAHSLGVYNSDIHCLNLFLDKDLDLKVGDWAGAEIDGSRSRSSYRLRHRLFDAEGNDVPRMATGVTAATEIFALGTALYYMVVGHDPWPELREPENRDEIKKRIRGQDFPDTSGLVVLGGVISKCWHVTFKSMTEVRRAVDGETRGDTKACFSTSRAADPIPASGNIASRRTVKSSSDVG